MHMHITKHNFGGVQPLVIERDGIELSVGGDDNCGRANNYERLEIAFYRKDGSRIENHPLAVKYDNMGGDGTISVWNDPLLMATVISEFVYEEDK